MKISQDQREVVVRAIGRERADALLSEFEQIVAGFVSAVSAEADHKCLRYPPTTLGKQRSAYEGIENAARDLQRALNAAPPIVREGILATMRRAMLVSTFGDWRPGDLFEEELAALADECNVAKRALPKGGSKTGPKPDRWRHALEVALAAAIERRGVHVTEYDRGPHVEVLITLLEVAGFKDARDRDPKSMLRRIVRAQR